MCLLTTQYRQIGIKDGSHSSQNDENREVPKIDPLLQILNEIRAGRVSEKSLNLLASRNVRVETEDHTELFTRNVSVDKYNTERLNAIYDDTFIFEMQHK